MAGSNNDYYNMEVVGSDSKANHNFLLIMKDLRDVERALDNCQDDMGHMVVYNIPLIVNHLCWPCGA
jgi:hypothetical protein